MPKLEPRGEAGRFIGYARDAKGYLIWVTQDRAVRTRRDVVFHDDVPTATHSPVDSLSPLWDNLLADSITPDPLRGTTAAEGMRDEPSPEDDSAVAQDRTPYVDTTFSCRTFCADYLYQGFGCPRCSG